jgi:hypothetical protein
LNIDEYLTQLEHTISSSPIVSNYILTIDRKTENMAFISGKIEMRYGYNYRKRTEVIFRYDNAPDPRARNLSTFPHHKHTAENVKAIVAGK